MISPETDREHAPSPDSRSGSFDDRRFPNVVPIVFVGGTGRSGTHIVSQFLGRNHKLTSIPVECRFHVDDDGFPGLLDGRVGKTRFLRKLRGFWWKGRQTGRTRGMFRFVEPEDFERGVARFEDEFDDDPQTACRNLFLDLLWPRAHQEGRQRDRRAELRHDRRIRDARRALSRGEVHPRRPRRPRRVGLPRRPEPQAALPPYETAGHRVVGVAHPADRRGRRRQSLKGDSWRSGSRICSLRRGGASARRWRGSPESDSAGR